jgi:hypothetical protein
MLLLHYAAHLYLQIQHILMSQTIDDESKSRALLEFHKSRHGIFQGSFGYIGLTDV